MHSKPIIDATPVMGTAANMYCHELVLSMVPLSSTDCTMSCSDGSFLSVALLSDASVMSDAASSEI